MKHLHRYISATALVSNILVSLLFINIFALGALLPPGAELGLDALKLGKERLGDLKEKIPAVHHNK